jgi:hypothetical protein
MSFLFTSASFPDVSAPLPAYVNGQEQEIANPDDQVSIAISDKTTVDVFDSVTTALRCMEFLRQREQWLLQASDDILVISCGSKLIVAEASLINQKLFSSFLPIYYGGQLRFHHRSMSSVLRLADALQTVGFCVQSPLLNNHDFKNATVKPYLLLVDINFAATTTSQAPGSVLDDGGTNQIIYKY